MIYSCIHTVRSDAKFFYYTIYSVPHEEKEIMLGMYDVTSIATIHCTKQNGRQKPALLQSEVALVAVYASRDTR